MLNASAETREGRHGARERQRLPTRGHQGTEARSVVALSRRSGRSGGAAGASGRSGLPVLPATGVPGIRRLGRQSRLRSLRLSARPARRAVSGGGAVVERPAPATRQAMTAAESAGGGEARQVDEIRAAIRLAIGNASLPRLRSVLRVEAAAGDGQDCGLCRAPISAQEYRYEIEAVSTVVRLHFRCFLVWYEESQRASDREPA